MKTQTSTLRFQIEKGVLLLGIQRAQGVIEKRSTAPIFSNVLIEGVSEKSGGRGKKPEAKPHISIIATDLEIGLRGIFPAQVESEGSIAVSGRKLHEIIRELPEGDIDIVVEEEKFLIIRSGSSYFKIAGSNKEDFPALPEMQEDRMAMIESKIYREMINKTIFAVAEAEARHVLNGALLEIEKAEGGRANIRMVGTDGHRLAVCERSIEDRKGLFDGESTGGESIRQMIIPKKTLLELRRLLDINEGIKIGVGEKQISFMGEDIYLTSRLIEGNYPNYKQVIPSKGEQTARLNRAQMVRAVRRVSVMSREKTRAITIEFFPEKAVLRARDPEIGEAMEETEAFFKGSNLTIGLNYQYLLDALESIEDEEVIIEMQSNLSPCIIKQESDPDSLSIVMPMRVQEAE